MTTFSYSPTYGAALKVQPRVRVASFGDGYKQRSGDGINRQARQWSLGFDGTKTEIDAIELFLGNEDGITAFDWTPPSGSAGKWICSAWTTSINEYDSWVLSSTFQEVFGE
jgi:phage-related protein